jgi:hypothetical protein
VAVVMRFPSVGEQAGDLTVTRRPDRGPYRERRWETTSRDRR